MEDFTEQKELKDIFLENESVPYLTNGLNNYSLATTSPVLIKPENIDIINQIYGKTRFTQIKKPDIPGVNCGGKCGNGTSQENIIITEDHLKKRKSKCSCGKDNCECSGEVQSDDSSNRDDKQFIKIPSPEEMKSLESGYYRSLKKSNSPKFMIQQFEANGIHIKKINNVYFSRIGYGDDLSFSKEFFEEPIRNDSTFLTLRENKQPISVNTIQNNGYLETIIVDEENHNIYSKVKYKKNDNNKWVLNVRNQIYNLEMDQDVSFELVNLITFVSWMALQMTAGKLSSKGKNGIQERPPSRCMPHDLLCSSMEFIGINKGGKWKQWFPCSGSFDVNVLDCCINHDIDLWCAEDVIDITWANIKVIECILNKTLRKAIKEMWWGCKWMAIPAGIFYGALAIIFARFYLPIILSWAYANPNMVGWHGSHKNSCVCGGLLPTKCCNPDSNPKECKKDGDYICYCEDCKWICYYEWRYYRELGRYLYERIYYRPGFDDKKKCCKNTPEPINKQCPKFVY